MIERNHDLSVTRQAQLLGMSRASVYYLPRPVSAADLALMCAIGECCSDKRGHFCRFTLLPSC